MTKDISTACFTRDGWHCQSCNSSQGLHPHHIKYKSHGGPDELENLITLCWICHGAVHAGILELKQERDSVTGLLHVTGFHWKGNR
jgi:hypothetical protein